MKTEPSRFFFFTIGLAALLLGWLVFSVIRPFVLPIAWAIVFATLFYPVYLAFQKWLRFKALASLATLALILVILIGPVSYLSYTLASELAVVVGKLKSGQISVGALAHTPAANSIINYLKGFFFFRDVDFEQKLNQALASLEGWLGGQVTGGAKNILTGIFDFALMGFSVFFLLKDGPGFINSLRGYLPLSDPQKDRLIKQVKDMVVSTIFGGVVVALAEGLTGGLAFLALGMGSPILWGAGIFIMSFVPVIGASGIWVPVAAWLFLTGGIVKGIALVLSGIVITAEDTLLRMAIISGRTKMHALLIFFSVLGGINLYGVIGLILGPLTVALFISVLEIFGNVEGGLNG
ncbi:MAG: AI-2E family transporter [Actinomycetota bacterium]|nr:AI-2E family transporter [Actinomycetota bacterium]